jgi:hypothetical protein
VFLKLAAIVAALGVVAAGLLSLRQSRLQVASELAQCQLRIGKADDRLWSVRTRVAAAVTPARVERLASSLGPLRPVTTPDVVGPALPSASPTYAQRPVIVLPAPVSPPAGPARIVTTSWGEPPRAQGKPKAPASTRPSPAPRPTSAQPAPTRGATTKPAPTRAAAKPAGVRVAARPRARGEKEATR